MSTDLSSPSKRRRQMHRSLRTVGASALLMLLVVLLPAPTLTARHDAWHLPMHLALETMAIVLASLVFAVVYSSARHTRLPTHVLLLGHAFLGVALLDFAHMLSYAGMPVFITPNSPDKSIVLSLAARLLAALALLGAAMSPWNGQAPPAVRGRGQRPVGMIIAGFVVLVLLLALGAPALLPTAFIPGQGPAGWKIGAEVLLIALYLWAAVVFCGHARHPHGTDARRLFVASSLMAMGSLLFALYEQVTDLTVLLGHAYTTLACVFVFRAVFGQTVRRPYALLHASEQRLTATLNALPDLFFEFDGHGRYLRLHTGNLEQLHGPTGGVQGKSLAEILPAEAARTAYAALDEAREHGVSRGKVIDLGEAAGNHRWFELSVSYKRVQDDQGERFFMLSRDVTTRQRDEQSLHLLSEAVEQSPVAIVITDVQARIEYVNKAFTRNSGYTQEQVLGCNPSLLQSGKTAPSTYRAMWERLGKGQSWSGELVNRDSAGREYTESVLIYPVRNPQGAVTHYLAHKEDVSEKKRSAERIQHLSQYDQLTGLPNRSLLQEQFLHARSRSESLALLWLDLDHFKDVNDALGHSMGDLLLLEMAHRLRATLRPQDMLTRQSGDEFIALLPDIGQGELAQLAERLLRTLDQPLQLAGQEIALSASMGIALYPDDAREFDDLLKNAETAMYRVKQDSRNSYCFFTPAMQEHSARTLALASALKLALARNELHLVYQPQIALEDGRVVGAEALLRWHSAQWGAVSPAEFIPIAESGGLIVPIGEWVLRTAMAQLVAWRAQGLPPLRIAVNLSAVQFNQVELPALVSRVLQETGARADELELELTEAATMKNPQAAAAQLQRLGELGVRLAIDDFGTGHSSLSYLKRFFLHALKIDQSFVRDIETDADDQAITGAIVDLARSLGLATVAEGVESAEQLAFLRARGCTHVQGYYFSRPLPPEQFHTFVQRSEREGVRAA